MSNEKFHTKESTDTINKLLWYTKAVQRYMALQILFLSKSLYYIALILNYVCVVSSLLRHSSFFQQNLSTIKCEQFKLSIIRNSCSFQEQENFCTRSSFLSSQKRNVSKFPCIPYKLLLYFSFFFFLVYCYFCRYYGIVYVKQILEALYKKTVLSDRFFSLKVFLGPASLDIVFFSLNSIGQMCKCDVNCKVKLRRMINIRAIHLLQYCNSVFFF